MRVNAAFQGKQLSLEESPCEVRKIITLPDKEFGFFKKHLMYDYDFLRKNKDQMGFHNGIRQCVLVMGESSEDGVLVDSSGYDYARYTASFLGARSYLAMQGQNLQANGELKTLTADDLAIIHAKHTLWVYGVDGEQADFSHCRISGLSLGSMQFNSTIFRNAVTYQQQTEYRDQLRQQGRESISDIVAQINAGIYRNPRIEELLIRLADRLSRTTGKKMYGYLKPDVKAIVDQIVAELAGDESIRKLYDLWYEQREDVLRTYTDTFPERIPLEQNKEFKSIRNAVIQEALKITPHFQQWADVGQRLRTEEEQPFSESQSPRENGFAPPYPLHYQEETGDGEDDSAILEEQRPVNTEYDPPILNSAEPTYIPGVARSVSALMAQLARLFQEQDQRWEKNRRQQIDRKQRRQIDEKKQAMGIRD